MSTVPALLAIKHLHDTPCNLNYVGANNQCLIQCFKNTHTTSSTQIRCDYISCEPMEINMLCTGQWKFTDLSSCCKKFRMAKIIYEAVKGTSILLKRSTELMSILQCTLDFLLNIEIACWELLTLSDVFLCKISARNVEATTSRLEY